VRRVLVIGLDGATFDLLAPWAASGALPELAALMARGCHGELRSTFPPLTPPAWASFMTGRTPGHHGVLGFRGKPAGYGPGSFVSARSLRAPTIFDLAGACGRTVGAMHVVPSHPVRPVNGFMVACMLAPPGARDVIFPPELAPLLGDDFCISLEPPEPFLADDPRYRDLCLDYLRRVRAMGRSRVAAAIRLLDARPCDLLTVVFYEPDRLQHRFWRHLTATGPDGVPAAVRDEIATEARAVFADLDAAIGTLVRAAGTEAITFVVSDHGFGPSPTRLVHVNLWLAEHGFLHRHRTWRLRRRLARRLPGALGARLDTLERVFLSWPRTRAWCEPYETRAGGIWVNVAGRQPEGCVAPGAEYEAVRDALCSGLRALADDGRPVFELVARREEVFDGPYAAEAPDVLLYTRPTHGLRFNGLRHELRARAPLADFQEYGFTGAHNPSGIYVVAGDGVAALGRQGARPIEALAPTILALLDVPVPAGLTAEPLLDLLTPAARAATRVERVADVPWAAPDYAGPPPTDEEHAETAARLRALGYVE
jgi:predicted AlkP superfamily phosphohydrolase/phosphomutase